MYRSVFVAPLLPTGSDDTEVYLGLKVFLFQTPYDHYTDRSPIGIGKLKALAHIESLLLPPLCFLL